MESLGPFEQLLLFSIVRLGDDAYGVTIRETIEERTGRAISSGVIYTAMARLEERGFVSSRRGRAHARPRGQAAQALPHRARGRAGTAVDVLHSLQAMAGGVIPRLTNIAEG